MIKILQGDWIERLKELPDASVHLCVTSPSYFGLRDYKCDGQLGLEKTVDEYVAKLVEGFREVRRVLHESGSMWLNLGACYANDGKWGGQTGGKHCRVLHASSAMGRDKKYTGYKPKDLILIPSLVAIALQQDGWYLRAACPWVKRNGMPESTGDRPTQVVETLFLLSKNPSYYYDAQAVKVVSSGGANGSTFDGNRDMGLKPNIGRKTRADDSVTRLRRSTDWFFESLLLDDDDEPMAFVFNTKPFRGAHFATFPQSLIRPCVLSGTSEKGCCPKCLAPWEREVHNTPMVIDRSDRTPFDGHSTRSSGNMVSPAISRTLGWKPSCDCNAGDPIPCTVLDPFSGAGTSCLVAKQEGRHGIGIELNPEYITMALKRCAEVPDVRESQEQLL